MTTPSASAYWQVQAPTTAQGERLRLVSAVREAVELALETCLTEVDPAEVARHTAALETAVDGLRGIVRARTPAAPAAIAPMLERSPFSGRANPRSSPWAVERDQEEEIVVATMTFPASVEGPPHHLHGGIIAGAFDELLGIAQHFSGAVGMTRSLSVTYHVPTPTRQTLVMRAGVAGRQDRRIWCWGTLHHDNTLTAEAEALFIAAR